MFSNAAIFYDYKHIGNIEELNQARKCKINFFYQTMPISRIQVTISITNDVLLKVNNIDIENNIKNTHDLRSNKLYMLSFEKVVREKQPTIKTVWYDNSE